MGKWENGATVVFQEKWAHEVTQEMTAHLDLRELLENLERLGLRVRQEKLDNKDAQDYPAQLVSLVALE